jgi:hypothetical protein
MPERRRLALPTIRRMDAEELLIGVAVERVTASKTIHVAIVFPLSNGIDLLCTRSTNKLSILHSFT